MSNDNKNNPFSFQTPNPTHFDESDPDMEMLMANLSIVREQTHELEAAIAGLEERLKLASGTGDVTPPRARAAHVHRRPCRERTEGAHYERPTSRQGHGNVRG
jgi:hypothetical protein